ncbi:hypothetical protein HPP92_022643 [Vanilla planifolia]|uniref:Uncharacterized protein n=1 Tax=Vanilla planifolia TaxID=51239 RepID=A0A835PRT4_VANPL|nr:hypothetical protein HPP92_022925 [Vanilla planifolia]KAG0459515.1 hypothetical protein HPP92_022643 [Vanilla planifolia]
MSRWIMWGMQLWWRKAGPRAAPTAILRLTAQSILFHLLPVVEDILQAAVFRNRTPKPLFSNLAVSQQRNEIAVLDLSMVSISALNSVTLPTDVFQL